MNYFPKLNYSFLAKFESAARSMGGLVSADKLKKWLTSMRNLRSNGRSRIDWKSKYENQLKQGNDRLCFGTKQMDDDMFTRNNLNLIAHTCPRTARRTHALYRLAVLFKAALMVIIVASEGAAQELTIDPVSWQGVNCYKVVTPWATLYFENNKGSSGFKSIVDRQGKDWLQAGYGWGNSFDWRGFPNMTEGNFGHASRDSGSTNTIEMSDPGHVIIASKNKRMECKYHFFPSHGAIEVIRANVKGYAFVWEGTNGGSVEPNADFFVLSDGIKRFAKKDRNTVENFPDQWLYFGDPTINDVFLMGMRPDDQALDENYNRENVFEIYSFGRGSGTNHDGFAYGRRTLSGTKNYLVYTFVEKSKPHEDIKIMINGLFADPYKAYRAK